MNHACTNILDECRENVNPKKEDLWLVADYLQMFDASLSWEGRPYSYVTFP